MAELLAQLWVLGTIPFQDPRIAAATPALLISWRIGNKSTALTVAIIAFSSIDLIIWFSSLPAAGAYQLPVPAAGGVGAGMALLGVHGMQDRVQGINLKAFASTIASSIADAIRGKR